MPKKEKDLPKEFLDLIPIGMLVSNKKGKIIHMNKAAAEIFGYPRKELIGNYITSIVKEKERTTKLVKRVTEDRTETNVEFTGVRRDESKLPLLVDGGFIKSGRKPEFIFLIKDMSELEHREADRESIEAEFLNITTHELKTPLTPVKAYLDTLLKGKLGEVKYSQKNALKAIDRNVRRLGRLIDDILDMTKLESGTIRFDMKKIQLSKIIDGAIADSSKSADEKSITIEKSISKIPPIEGDSERLQQVFVNILDNAIKFTPSGGKIRIKSKRRGYSIITSISDTGIGIPKSKLDRVFDKFYQIDSSVMRKHPGTGLGLTICRGIIKAHGGGIEAKSEGNGKGSTFLIELPYKKLGKPIELFAKEVKE